MFHASQLTLHESSPSCWQQLVFFSSPQPSQLAKSFWRTPIIPGTSHTCSYEENCSLPGNWGNPKAVTCPRSGNALEAEPGRQTQGSCLGPSVWLTVTAMRCLTQPLQLSDTYQSLLRLQKSTQEPQPSTCRCEHHWLYTCSPRPHLLPVLDKVTGSTWWQTMIKPSHFVTVRHWPWTLGLGRSSPISAGSPGKAAANAF